MLKILHAIISMKTDKKLKLKIDEKSYENILVYGIL